MRKNKKGRKKGVREEGTKERTKGRSVEKLIQEGRGKDGGTTERPGERKILTTKPLQIQRSSKKLKATAFL